MNSDRVLTSFQARGHMSAAALESHPVASGSGSIASSSKGKNKASPNFGDDARQDVRAFAAVCTFSLTVTVRELKGSFSKLPR